MRSSMAMVLRRVRWRRDLAMRPWLGEPMAAMATKAPATTAIMPAALREEGMPSISGTKEARR